jgi:hypothetical protein
MIAKGMRHLTADISQSQAPGKVRAGRSDQRNTS